MTLNFLILNLYLSNDISNLNKTIQKLKKLKNNS